VPVDSTEAEATKRVLAQKIRAATHFLCIVGKYSYSGWVPWEINKAKELKKKLVGVKINRENTSPEALVGSEAAWAMSFTREEVLKALKKSRLQNTDAIFPVHFYFDGHANFFYFLCRCWYVHRQCG
jgi:hypothetical protein